MKTTLCHRRYWSSCSLLGATGFEEEKFYKQRATAVPRHTKSSIGINWKALRDLLLQISNNRSRIYHCSEIRPCTGRKSQFSKPYSHLTPLRLVLPYEYLDATRTSVLSAIEDRVILGPLFRHNTNFVTWPRSFFYLCHDNGNSLTNTSMWRQTDGRTDRRICHMASTALCTASNVPRCEKAGMYNRLLYTCMSSQ